MPCHVCSSKQSWHLSAVRACLQEGGVGQNKGVDAVRRSNLLQVLDHCAQFGHLHHSHQAAVSTGLVTKPADH